jgi:hypothetical protein
MDLILVLLGLLVLVAGGVSGLGHPESNTGGLLAIAGAILLSTGTTMHYFLLYQRRSREGRSAVTGKVSETQTPM